MTIEAVRWMPLHTFRDQRGQLTVIEGPGHVPFEIRRVFYMHNVEEGRDRGGHAHTDTDQLAIAVHGSVRILASDGAEARMCVLDHPGWGLVLPRLTWTRLMDFRNGAVCMVLASTHYDISRSIRSWPAYLDALGRAPCPEPTSAIQLLRPASALP